MAQQTKSINKWGFPLNRDKSFLLVASESSLCNNTLADLSTSPLIPVCLALGAYTMTSIDSILAGKYPAKGHARRVVAYLRQNGFEGDGVIYLEAQKSRLIEDNDSEEPFRSVSLGICFLFAVMYLR